MQIFLSIYKSALNKCGGCGYCAAFCPVFKLERREADGPRGVVTLLKSANAASFPMRELAKFLEKCTGCGRCEKVCPADLPLQKIFFEARKKVSKYLRLTTALKNFYRLSLISGAPALALQSLRLVNDWELMRFSPGFKGILRLGKSSAPQKSGRMARTSFAGRALIFEGCLGRYLFPQLAQSASRALRERNFDVQTSKGAACCGRPLALAGNAKKLKKFVARNLKALSGDYDFLVSPCPGCVAQISEMWETVSLNDEERKILQSIRGKLTDIYKLLTEFPTRSESEEKDIVKESIILHKPCLMDGENMKFLRACLNDCGAVGKNEYDACCGAPALCLQRENPKEALPQFSGEDSIWNEGVKSPKSLPEAILQKFYEELQVTEGSSLITACPGCLLQLKKSAPYGFSARHALEII